MKAALLTLVEVADPSSTVLEITIPIYWWSGEYFGFIYDNNLFDATSNYLGWLENDGRVWRSNGVFLGQLVDDNYILKQTDSIDPGPKVPPAQPSSPIPPFPKPNRVGRILPSGWQDAFEKF